ncbi:MAG TPA: type IV pilus modification protein PilV [Steroidobacteraceae bacterium]|nr:type IV pilus modification protein PilV [Steroidobacteraceae bacterium]
MHATHTARSNSGFTLVEVLVTLLVLSIGLLGIAKLLLVSSRANDSAYMRTQATALAYSILDSMRANRQTAVSGGYSASTATVTDPGVTCSTAASPCSNAIIAQLDLWQWKNDLANGLPAGAGSVTTANVTDPVTGGSDVTATVTVQWNDTVAQQAFGAAAGNVSITLETVL